MRSGVMCSKRRGRDGGRDNDRKKEERSKKDTPKESIIVIKD